MSLCIQNPYSPAQMGKPVVEHKIKYNSIILETENKNQRERCTHTVAYQWRTEEKTINWFVKLGIEN